MNVLFFCPTLEKSNAEQVFGIIHDSASKTDLPNVEIIDESSTSFSLENKNYDAVIIVYTPAVEFSGTLFEIVRYIDQNKPLGRFIFLPKTDGKEIIPPIFHPIRALQFRLFYYSLSGDSPNHLEAQLVAFQVDWHKFIDPNPVEPTGKRSKRGGSRQAGFGLILLASILILFLTGLITIILSTLPKPLFTPTPTSIRPPAAIAFWLQESFQTIDTTTRWQEQHYYTGQQAIQTTFSGAALRLSASPVVTDAVFQLDSLQEWPLDELQSLSFSFALSALDDPSAKNALVFGLYLSEDSAYRLECLILPAETDGRIQCQIQSPTQTGALSEAVPLSLGVVHTANLVFDPLTYTLQFFLDDQYHGQGEIPAVEYWRTRSFKLQVRDQVQNLNSGSFSYEMYSLSLAHQP